MEGQLEKRNRMWRQYARTRDPGIRTQLIFDSAGVLKWSVGRAALDLPPGISQDTLLDYAIQELFRVIESPLPPHPAQFDTYLASRVRKAILEGLRRSLGSDASIYRVVGPSLFRCASWFREKGRLPGPAEMLGDEEAPFETEERLLAGMSLAALLLSASMLSGDGDPGEAAAAGFAGALEGAISRLPRNERTLLTLYHYEELTISEICSVLKASRRAVCALFTVATLHVLGQVVRVLVRVSEDRMEAEACVYPWLDGPGKGAFPDGNTVERSLRDFGIVHGLDAAALEDLVSPPLAGRIATVARGTPPVRGKDGRVERLFEDDGTGSNGWTKRRVKQGDPLVGLVPAGRGTPGRDVTGNAIPAEDGARPAVSTGANARMAENGLKIHAAIDGQAWFNGEFVDVVAVMELEEVGEGHRAAFPGTIVVKGIIRSGSRVVAEWDVMAERIDGAQVVAGGDVTVSGGIVGCEAPGIRAGGDIRARFIEASSVHAGGSLICSEYVIHSTAEACAGLAAKGGWVCGGQVSSGAGVVLGLAGGELGTHTMVAAGSRSLIHEMMVALHRVLRSDVAPAGTLVRKYVEGMISMLQNLPQMAKCTIRAGTGIKSGVTLSIAGSVKFVAEDLGAGVASLDRNGVVTWRALRVH
ncbi:MAG: flagellar assembly protein A [Ignavibacteriales bacterium]